MNYNISQKIPDIQDFNFNTNENSYILKSDYEDEYRRFLSLGWHYIVKGDSINDI